MKKILSMAMALVMLLGVMVIGVSADDPAVNAPDAKGYQKTDVYVNGSGDKVYDIRFVAAVDETIEDCTKVGFVITANTASGIEKTWTRESTTVYTALLATTPTGETATAVSALDYSATALIAITITGIPAIEEVSFQVQPFVKDAENAAVEGELKRCSTSNALSNTGFTAEVEAGVMTGYSTRLIPKIFDGVMKGGVDTGRFASSKGGDAEDYWFVIDFGAEISFDYIYDNDYNSGIWTTWDFYTSSDKSSWSAIDGADVTCTKVDAYNVNFAFANTVTTRYLKVSVNHEAERLASGTVSIWELKFFNFGISTKGDDDLVGKVYGQVSATGSKGLANNKQWDNGRLYDGVRDTSSSCVKITIGDPTYFKMQLSEQSNIDKIIICGRYDKTPAQITKLHIYVTDTASLYSAGKNNTPSDAWTSDGWTEVTIASQSIDGSNLTVNLADGGVDATYVLFKFTCDAVPELGEVEFYGKN